MRESDKRDERIDLAGLVTAASRRVASQRLVSGTLPDVRKATEYPVQENNPVTGMKIYYLISLFVCLIILLKKILTSLLLIRLLSRKNLEKPIFPPESE